MYAVIQTGGKQYRVQQGDVIYVEKLNEQEGAEVSFDVLLLAGDEGCQVGAPVVKGAKVTLTCAKTGKTVEKNLSASEMNKRRLEYARQLDAERYKDERTVPLSELNKQDKE